MSGDLNVTRSCELKTDGLRGIFQGTVSAYAALCRPRTVDVLRSSPAVVSDRRS